MGSIPCRGVVGSVARGSQLVEIGGQCPRPMVARFHVPDLEPSTRLARLPADEAHHLTRVLRLEIGAIVGVIASGNVDALGSLMPVAGTSLGEIIAMVVGGGVGGALGGMFKNR